MKHLLSNHSVTDLGPLFAKATTEGEEHYYVPDGKALRDKGLAQVSEHNENWMTKAIEAAREWVGIFGHIAPNDDFTGEDIRMMLITIKLGEPSHPNAYGALINTLLKRKIIVHTGEYRKMKDRSSHARSTPVYKASA